MLSWFGQIEQFILTKCWTFFGAESLWWLVCITFGITLIMIALSLEIKQEAHQRQEPLSNVIDERRRTTNVGRRVRQKRHWAFCLKKIGKKMQEEKTVDY